MRQTAPFGDARQRRLLPAYANGANFLLTDRTGDVRRSRAEETAMSARFALLALATPTLTAALFAAPALAQQEPDPRIDYRSGQYQFPAQTSATQDAAVVTHTVPADEAPLPAERVIPARQTGPAPVFVPFPVVQDTRTAAPVQVVAQVPVGQAIVVAPVAAYAQPPVYYSYPAPAAPVAYAYPSGGAARVIYPAGATQPVGVGAPAYGYAQNYAAAAALLPAGAQIVTFDRGIWLTACRDRLAGYAPEDRDAAIAALGGAAAGYQPGRDHCESYLDSYMASAAAGTLTVPQQYGQQYMLVPVTVLVAPPPAPRD